MPTNISNDRCWEVKVVLGIKSRIEGTEQKRRSIIISEMFALVLKRSRGVSQKYVTPNVLEKWAQLDWDPDFLQWISKWGVLLWVVLRVFFSTKMFIVLHFSYNRRKPFPWLIPPGSWSCLSSAAQARLRSSMCQRRNYTRGIQCL